MKRVLWGLALRRSRAYQGRALDRQPRAAGRHLRVVTDDDGAARRPSGAGLVVIGCVVACVLFYALGLVAARLWSVR